MQLKSKSFAICVSFGDVISLGGYHFITQQTLLTLFNKWAGPHMTKTIKNIQRMNEKHKNYKQEKQKRLKGSLKSEATLSDFNFL